jgi:hypothetical protein
MLAWDDDAEGWTIVAPRAYFQKWVDDQAEASSEFGVALAGLTGCDSAKLGWLLSALANAQGWRTMSRDQARDSAKQLATAAKAVRRLFFSQLGRVLRLDSLRLEGELSDLAKRLRELAPHVHGRRPMFRDLVRATLVHHVHEKTGQWHDEEVAALISVAESLKEVDERFAAAADAQPTEDYTAEAHVQWRNRPSCRALLNGPSRAVRQLLTLMEEDTEDS